MNCPIDCEGKWDNWDECDNACDEQRTTLRMYNVTKSNQYGGKYCENNNNTVYDGDIDASNCPFVNCPVDCRGEWGRWETCKMIVFIDTRFQQLTDIMKFLSLINMVVVIV